VVTGLGIVTPLSQTNFLPDLIQVKSLPLAVAVSPALLQTAPALGVAAIVGVVKPKTIKESVDSKVSIDLEAFHIRVI
jgi:hypothetical protein